MSKRLIVIAVAQLLLLSFGCNRYVDEKDQKLLIDHCGSKPVPTPEETLQIMYLIGLDWGRRDQLTRCLIARDKVLLGQAQ